MKSIKLSIGGILQENCSSRNFKLGFQLLFTFLCFNSLMVAGQTSQWLTGFQSNIHRFSASNGTNLDLRLNLTTNLGFYTNRPYFLFHQDVQLKSGLIGSEGTSNLRLHTNGVERLRVLNSNGFVGLNNTSPVHHLQIHGTTDYITGGAVMINEGENSLNTNKNQTNYGKTARFSLTNSVSGNGSEDGGLILQDENNLRIWNQENGNMYLKASGGDMLFQAGGQFKISNQYNRIIAGNSLFLNLADVKYGAFSISSTTDNGIYVQTNTTNKYGVSVNVRDSESTAFVSTFYGETEPHFKVTGGGVVYARRFVTTLDPFPDYVFESDYDLMSLGELKQFIGREGHLPNMPTAEEIKEKGADLGEINRVLVEKVEELTLYILKLQERLSEIEDERNSTDSRETALLDRIEKLEELLEQLIDEK